MSTDTEPRDGITSATKSEPFCHKPPFDIGLLLIERKSDVIAFVALILSSVSFLAALGWFFQGAEPSILAPDTIVFEGLNEGDGFQETLGISAVISYVNKGEVNQPWIVVSESVRFALPGDPGRYSLHATGNRQLIQAGDTLFDLAEHAGANGPFVVPGGGVTSHMTGFAPKRLAPTDSDPDRDFLTVVEFAEPLMAAWRAGATGKPIDEAKANTTVALSLEFCAKGLDGDLVGVACTVHFYYEDLWDLVGNGARTIRSDSPGNALLATGWTALDCFTDEKRRPPTCK